MTGTTSPTPLAVQTFLFGDEDDRSRVAELSHALDEQQVGRNLKDWVGNLSEAGYQAIDGQLAETANEALNGDLGSLVLAAWQKWGKLVDAAKATVEEPERAEVVTLDEQRIVSQRRPHVDVLVDGAKVTSFTFILSLEFIIKTLVAVVRHGSLVAVQCGTTVVVGTLELEGCPRPIKQCQRTIDLPLAVNLGPGIPLLGQQPNDQ
jgi:hypothetical protein